MGRDGLGGAGKLRKHALVRSRMEHSGKGGGARKDGCVVQAGAGEVAPRRTKVVRMGTYESAGSGHRKALNSLYTYMQKHVMPSHM